MQEIDFIPRLDLVLAKRHKKITKVQKVVGDVSNPEIIEVGEEVPMKNYIDIVKSNPKIEDLPEGTVAHFSERAMELTINGEIFYLVKNQDINGTIPSGDPL